MAKNSHLMLLQLLPYTPFETPRTERLSVLEQHLRRKAYGEFKLIDYVEWLEHGQIKLPNRRTLHEDLRRYADFCDDVTYGGTQKTFSLNIAATRDAIAWLMGQAWLASPLKPRLSSACLRCLLMAQQLNQEVRIFYKRLQQPKEAWRPEIITGKVLRIITGSDGGYIQIQQKTAPERINLNLLRMQTVEFTGSSGNSYPPEPSDPDRQIIIQDEDIYLLERLRSQYNGFQQLDKHRLQLTVPDSLVLMTDDLLRAHIQRTHDSNAKQRTLKEHYSIKTTDLQWSDKET